jgi:hypothetical protein
MIAAQTASRRRLDENGAAPATMTLQAKYVHTNLIAQDCGAGRVLSAVFGCVPVPPERDLSGLLMEAGTGLPGASARNASAFAGWRYRPHTGNL